MCDIDEVVLEFLTPFTKFLNSRGLNLEPNSFSLNGNIINLKTNLYVQNHHVDELIEDFYSTQIKWQRPLPDAAASLKRLTQHMEVIFLTAMPARHQENRKRLLEKFEMPYPLIASESAKGPIINQHHMGRSNPAFFIDDMHYNLHSAREHVSNINLITIMANKTFKAIAPRPSADIFDADNWPEIEAHILEKI